MSIRDLPPRQRPSWQPRDLTRTSLAPEAAARRDWDNFKRQGARLRPGRREGGETPHGEATTSHHCLSAACGVGRAAFARESRTSRPTFRFSHPREQPDEHGDEHHRHLGHPRLSSTGQNGGTVNSLYGLCPLAEHVFCFTVNCHLANLARNRKRRHGLKYKSTLGQSLWRRTWHVSWIARARRGAAHGRRGRKGRGGKGTGRAGRNREVCE